jgi:hypothetical protein
MASHAPAQEGHLQKRFSKLTMIGMAFAILK